MNQNNKGKMGPGYVVLSFREKVGYGLGDFASNISFTFATLFLMSFYTDVYGLSVVQASTIFLVARVLDAIFNLLLGVVIDKTKSRHGKLRPYLLYGNFPLGLMTSLCFIVYDSEYKYPIALVTYTLFCFAYTLVNTPYSALTNRLTQHEQSRASLSVFRIVLAFAAYLLVATGFGPAIQLAGNNTAGYFWIVTLGAVVATLCFWACFAGTQERIPQEQNDRVNFKVGIKVLVGNPPLIILCIATAFFYIAYTVWMAVAVYFVHYVIGDEGYLATFFGIQGMAYVIGTMMSGKLIGWLGKKKFSVWALWTGAAVLVLQYLVPEPSHMFIMACVVVFSLVIAAIFVVFWTMIADTVEYGEWKERCRADGFIYGFYNFVTKVAMGLGGGVVGLLLGYYGYDALHVTADAIQGINVGMTLIPAAMLVCCALSIKFYRIDEATYKSIVSSIEERRTNQVSVKEILV